MSKIDTTDTEECPDCGGVLKHKLTATKTGVKAAESRNDTEKHIFVCRDCGVEGRKFVDGVTGAITLSGVLR